MNRKVLASVAAPAPIATDRDLELAKAVIGRDRKATAELVALYSDAVHAYVRRRLLPRTDLVDDLVQDITIRRVR